jgi:penicillin-binding protein 1A
VATTKPAKKRVPLHAPTRRSRSVRNGDPKPKGFWRRRWWLVALLTPVVLALLGIGVLLIAYARIDLPETLPPIQSTQLFDRNGRPIATLHAAVDREIVPLSQISQPMQDAILAVEDHGFYEHSGFDPVGILRAAYKDLVEREVVQGASTITQQVVKNVYEGTYVTDEETGLRRYVLPERSIPNKIREVLLSIKLEQELTKDEILETYLNTVYFGHGAYGIQAAAQTYYGIPASELNVLQSASLAGVLHAPADYDPAEHPYDNEFRRDYALDQLARYGYLDPARAAVLKEKECCGTVEGSEERIVAPFRSEYFVEYTRARLFQRLGIAEVYSGGYRVTTSLDLDLQRAAEEAVFSHLPDAKDPGSALVAIDPRNGEVIAMVGGANWKKQKVNYATFPCAGCGRQAGSAFKAFTLAEAMRQRFSLRETWSGPSTITIPDPICNDQNGEPWTPTNAEGSGTYSLQAATAHSVNTIFAQLVVELGPSNVAEMAHRLGIRSELPEVCSITLGSVAVNPLEMTNAYATLAARGERHWATPFVEIASPSGDRVEPGRTRVKQVIDQNDADLVTYALQDVVKYGTGRSAVVGLNRPIAGKTGTAQDNSDAWFCGYTPQLAACVWVGYPQAEKELSNIHGVPLVYGGTIPAAIWHDFMEVALDGRPVREFAQPDFGGYDEGPSQPVPTAAPEPTGPTGPTAPVTGPTAPVTGPTGPTGGTGPTGVTGGVLLVVPTWVVWRRRRRRARPSHRRGSG